MPTVLKFRRGTTSQNDAFTGAAGELSIDTQTDNLRLHDGSTAGGFELTRNTATQTLTNKTLTTPTLTTPVINTGADLKNGSTSAGFLKFFEDSDNGTNAVTLIGPASTADVTLTLPAATDTLVGKATTDTLTNKTLTTPTIDTINSSGFTLDSSGDINLDADGADVIIKDGGTEIGRFTNSSSDFVIKSAVSDKDIIFKGNDGGSEVTALTLDMSAAGNATFAADLTVTGNFTVNGTTTTVSTTNTTVSDNLIELNSGAGSNANDSGILIERGSTGDNAFIGFDESADKFIVGTTTATNTATGNLTISTGTLVANIEGNVTGNTSGTAATVTGAAQSNITSLGTLTTLTVDNVIINGTTIGHTDDTDLITLADGIATVAGEISVTTLDIGGTNVTSTGTELNIVDGDTSAGTTAVAGGDGIVTNDNGTMRQTTVDTFDTYLSATTKTLTNKTTTNLVLNGTATGTAIKDEDNMASDSATHLATQQSIKAYVDTEIGNISSTAISQGNSNVTVADSGTGNVTIEVDGTDRITTVAATTTTATGHSIVLGAAANDTGGSIKFLEGTDNGTNGVTLSGPASTADVTVTLPTQAGTVVVSNQTAGNDVRVDSLGVAVDASGTSGEIRATNDITAFHSSDVILKENINNIPNPMDMVSKLNGVLFDWKDSFIESKGGEDGYFVRKKDVGVVAQDVESVLPEIVGTRPDGIKAVKYDRLCALLIECVKDLQEQVNNLKK
jgi:hypothetical protein